MVRWRLAHAAHRGAHAQGLERLSNPKHMRAGNAASLAASAISAQAKARTKAMMILALSAVVLVAALCIGAGFASAGNPAVAPANTGATQASSSTTASTDGSAAAVLGAAATRDMTTQIDQVQREEEAIRLAAEAKAREEEQQAISRAQQAQAKSNATGGVGAYGVDFSIGKEAFVSEWTARIDRYLAGSNLAGYGATFAQAAWDNGVDPRWSPAISNTESTKGANCFAPHNAWGWTGGAWSSWDSAIRAHVKGLADIYGFTISYANAKKYCPPNADNWYRDTLNEMSKI